MTLGPVTLPRSAKRYEDLRSIGGAAVVIALAWALAYTLIPDPWGLRVATGVSGLAAVFTCVDVLVANRRLVRFFSAGVADGILTTRNGRLFMTETSIRRDAVLSVDVLTGPLLRKWDLARIKLNGIANFPELPPLAHADAVAIQKAMTASETPVLQERL